MVHMKDGKYFCRCGKELGPKEDGQWFCDNCKSLYYKPDEPITLMKWIKKENKDRTSNNKNVGSRPTRSIKKEKELKNKTD